MGDLERDLSVSNMELLKNKSRAVKQVIQEIQNEAVNFCRDANFLQAKKSLFDSKFISQMDFNHCIDFVTSSIQKDLDDIEESYSQCKNSCGDVSEDIERFVNSQFVLTRPSLPTCVNYCIENYYMFLNMYYSYMVTGKGVYIEYVDYPKV